MKFNNPRFLFRRYEVMKMIKSSDHFLEIGPGTLSLALDLLTKFNRGTLMDFNTTDVREIYDNLTKEQKQKLNLIIADFSTYDQLDNKYDCVVACEVLEHVEYDAAFLTKTYNLLLDDGQLVISVPARQKFWSKDDEIVGHYRRYEKQDLYEKLVGAGYSEIKIASYGYPFMIFVRFFRITLAKLQYREKSEWDRKKQSQKSAFLLKRNSRLDWLGLFVNKYSLYPFGVLASYFNHLDLSEGYVATANKVRRNKEIL